MGLFSFVGDLFGGSSKSSVSSTASTSNQYRYDTLTTNNLGQAAAQLSGYGNSVDNSADTYLTDMSNRSTSNWAQDLSNRSTNISDLSNRSTSNWAQDVSNRSTNISDSSNRSTSNSLSNWAQDNSNRSTNSSSWLQDLSNRSTNNSTSSYSLDASNRATNTSTQITTDTGHNVTINADGTRIAELGAALLGDMSDNQSDSLKALAGFGAAGQKALADEAVNLFGDNVAAWTHTVSTADKLLGSMFDAAQKQQQGAERIASQAIQSFQPVQNAQAASQSKMLMVGAAIIGAVIIMR